MMTAHPTGCKMIVVVVGQKMKPTLLSPSCQRSHLQGHALKNLRRTALCCCTTNSFEKENDDGGAESLLL
jgi:hypothetical protein